MMAQKQGVVARLKDHISWSHQEWCRSWRENDVPKCANCRGSGEACDDPWGGTLVYWKGRLVPACSTCGGSGRM